MTTTLSYWEKSQIESAPDFTIIGAGIVGLSTAISIQEKQPNASVVIFERGRLPYGASTKNAGFSCFGSVSELIDDIDSMGLDNTLDIVEMRIKGLEKLKSRCSIINMDYLQSGGVEVFRKEDTDLLNQCLDNIPTLNKVFKKYFGIHVCYTAQNHSHLPHFHETSILNTHEGVINPVKMMETLLKIAYEKGIKIYFGFDILNIDKENKILNTEDGWNIKYKHLIVCTNGFTSKLLPDIEVVPARNQVLITKPIDLSIPHSGYHLDKGYVYFRRVGDRLLLGGGRNVDTANETVAEFGNTQTIQDYLIKILDDIHPRASQHIDMWWSGILGVGSEKRPIITHISDNITIGVRLGGMGVAIGSYLGDMLSDKVLQKDHH